MVKSKIQDKEGIPPDHALLILDLAEANKRQSSDGGQSKNMLEIDTSDRNKVQCATCRLRHGEPRVSAQTQARFSSQELIKS
jgi:hypothetical protein